MDKYSIGIDIGGTKCAVVLGKAQIREDNLDCFILERISFQTEVEKGPDNTIRSIFGAIEEILRKYSLNIADSVGIGISCGGPLEHKRGVIMNPPNLYGWDNIPIVKIFEDRFHIPTFIENDANACALAEWQFGAAKGFKDIVFLTFGTGMGAGLILNGRLYNGTNGMAGEIGHIRLAESGPVGFGKAGSMEGFCSGNGIAQIARIKALEQLQMGISPAICPDLESLPLLNAKNVAIAADAGDTLAQEIYRTSGRYLGKGLSILVDILNPEIIVLGSIYARSEDLIWPSAVEILKREALDRSLACCRIVSAKLGDQLGDYAALSVALQGRNSTCT